MTAEHAFGGAVIAAAVEYPADATAGGERLAPISAPDNAAIATLIATPRELERIFRDYSAQHLAQPSDDGGMSVVEVLCHLADWETINVERVARMIDDDHPELPNFDDTLWSVEHGYEEIAPDVALAGFVDRRHELLSLLAGLAPGQWQRTAWLEGRGDITIQWMIATVARHDEKHLTQVRDALG